MKKYIILFLLITCLLSYTFGDDRILLSSLTFEDQNLADFVYNSGCTYADELIELFAYNENISNLSGIENLTSLTYLYLHDNNISDISALSGLTNLTELHLGDNTITIGVATLVTLVNAYFIDFRGNSGIPAADLDTLETALGDEIVIRPDGS